MYNMGCLHKYGKALIIALCIILLSIGVWEYGDIKEQFVRKTIKPGEYNFKNITSIQYQEVKESSGHGDGKQVTTTLISYVYPDKLRLETNGVNKIVEIYNNDSYIYYDDSSNKIKVKECFAPDKPYITEIEKRMAEIFNSGNYEFFGYEELENKKCEVIGIKSKVDGQNYMHKLWITNINKTTLPIKEEYFINNSVVSKASYDYLKVNEPINPDIFNKTSLPQVVIVNDGVVPKFVQTFEEAQKYINYKLMLPTKIPGDFLPSEIAVIPPVKTPSFYCIFFSDGYRIYLGERKGMVTIKKNGKIGDTPCEFSKEDEKISISWNQGGLYIVLTGDEDVEKTITDIAEQIGGGQFSVEEIP